MPPTSIGFHAQAAWEPYLSSLLDQCFAALNGFCIGADLSHSLHSSTANMSSELTNPEVVDKYIAEEVGSGKLQVVTNPEEVNSHALQPARHYPEALSTRQICQVSPVITHELPDLSPSESLRVPVYSCKQLPTPQGTIHHKAKMSTGKHQH